MSDERKPVAMAAPLRVRAVVNVGECFRRGRSRGPLSEADAMCIAFGAEWPTADETVACPTTFLGHAYDHLEEYGREEAHKAGLTDVEIMRVGPTEYYNPGSEPTLPPDTPYMPYLIQVIVRKAT